MALAGCSDKGGAGGVNADRIIAADSTPGDWISHGRTYSEQRFSPLEKINTSNVQDLGLAWSFELPENRGIEATPLVTGGVMYTTSAWSIVRALDAKTGKLLWTYDPKA
jgi:glucose dehydrogenase